MVSSLILYLSITHYRTTLERSSYAIVYTSLALRPRAEPGEDSFTVHWYFLVTTSCTTTLHPRPLPFTINAPCPACHQPYHYNQPCRTYTTHYTTLGTTVSNSSWSSRTVTEDSFPGIESCPDTASSSVSSGPNMRNSPTNVSITCFTTPTFL